MKKINTHKLTSKKQKPRYEYVSGLLFLKFIPFSYR
jgi:hypothetical protein